VVFSITTGTLLPVLYCAKCLKLEDQEYKNETDSFVRGRAAVRQSESIILSTSGSTLAKT
jgi:hypothetical protein